MLTREEIEKMPAGEQMNIAIAEHVLGHVWVHNKRYGCLLPADHAKVAIAEGIIKAGKHPEHEASCWISPLDRYSNVVEAAWLVLEAMQQRGGFFKVENGAGGDTKGWRAELLYRGSFYDPHLCETAPVAICRAALLALLEAPSPSPLPPTEKQKA